MTVLSTKEFDFEELRKATQDFHPSRLLGRGSHGCVYRGDLQGGRAVAVKALSSGLRALGDGSRLSNEAAVLASLPPAGIESVVSLLGTSRPEKGDGAGDGAVACGSVLVMELMPNGSLHDLLHPDDDEDEDGGKPTALLSWPRRVQAALQVARGLRLLHALGPPVVHRDVKPANVLFDSGWHARLADFGLAVRLGEDGKNEPSRDESINDRPAGTIGYMDPGYTAPYMLSPKTDVYSFGVVLLEIISGQKAIDPSRASTSIVDWALPLIKQRNYERVFDKRVSMPMFIEGEARRLLGIAARCVSGSGDDRPTMEEVVGEMEGFRVRRGRLRFPLWVSLLRGMMVLRGERRGTEMETRTRRSKKRVRRRESVVLDDSDVVIPKGKGKLMLKDILADIAYV